MKENFQSKRENTVGRLRGAQQLSNDDTQDGNMWGHARSLGRQKQVLQKPCKVTLSGSPLIMLVNNHEGTRPRVHRLSFFKAWMQAEDEASG